MRLLIELPLRRTEGLTLSVENPSEGKGAWGGGGGGGLSRRDTILPVSSCSEAGDRPTELVSAYQASVHTKRHDFCACVDVKRRKSLAYP